MAPPSKDTALRLLACLVSGVALVHISAPVNLHWLHWFAFVPMFWAMRPGQGRRNAWMAWAGGWLAIFWLYYWLIETIIRFSNLPWVLALLIHLLFATAFSINYPLVFGTVRWLRRRIGAGWVVATPVLLVATEKLFPSLFPYYHGVSQYRFPPTWQLASVLGVMGLTFLIFLVNCTLTEALWRRSEGRRQPWGLHAVIAALFVGNIAWGTWRHGAIEAQLAEAPVVKAALLQHDVTMEVRLRTSALQALQTWLIATREVLEEEPDLVVWPEGSTSFNPHGEKVAKALSNRSPRQFFETLAKGGDFDLLVGGGTAEVGENGEITGYNSCYLFSREGKLADRYDKMVPLPFGEYIPFGDTFPWIRRMIRGPGNFRAGERPTVFDGTAADGTAYTFSVPICYEAILESAMWDLFEGERDSPVDLFVNITNDAWFGDTASPHQHAMLTTIQAIQFGRPMLRIAYTGICWVVEPHGDILFETTPFTDHRSVRPIRMATVPTLYVAGGWMFPWLCVLGSIGVFAIARRRGDDGPLAPPTSGEAPPESVAPGSVTPGGESA